MICKLNEESKVTSGPEKESATMKIFYSNANETICIDRQKFLASLLYLSINISGNKIMHCHHSCNSTDEVGELSTLSVLST
uniref:Uncharacterized protein n=1 Tax=Onchocerca volvulus TaxID=6282 RepID=A0A8R1TSB2_ONCVO